MTPSFFAAFEIEFPDETLVAILFQTNVKFHTQQSSFVKQKTNFDVIKCRAQCNLPNDSRCRR